MQDDDDKIVALLTEIRDGQREQMQFARDQVERAKVLQANILRRQRRSRIVMGTMTIFTWALIGFLAVLLFRSR